MTQLGKNPTVAIFGAGIGGLTTAHELVKLGYQVSLYEANPTLGGFFRSARRPEDHNMPSEYSWHGFGPCYHNAFDLFREIPFDEKGSLYDLALSRPIDFGLFPEEGEAAFYDWGWLSIPKMFRLSWGDFVKATWLMLKTWASNLRTEKRYARLNAAERWKPLMSERGYLTWRACFGPWIGSDWTKVSLHHAGQFFRNQLTTNPPHHHRADQDGPAWTHGRGNGWLLLRGPSSEFWFDRWERHLQAAGVKFFYRQTLDQLEFEGSSITLARLASGREVRADFYVLATNPFAAAQILARTPALERQEPLCHFNPLIQDGPHTQVSFRIAFSEPIVFPRPRTGVVLVDSEFNITLFAEEQVWRKEVELGDQVRSLWTGTTCTGTVPGRIHKLPVIQCSKEQYIEEVKAQIFACESLDALVRAANSGRGLADFAIERIEVWHEWDFSGEKVQARWPKWVTTTNTQPHVPGQVTALTNLFLAGAHTRTTMDLWSVEAAVESGRLAARAIDPRVQVLSQYKPLWLRVLSGVDDLCYRLGAPHVLDLLLAALALTALVVLVRS